ncbi:MAG TPA: class I SAM-dependent methyltransferase [Flavitalea sp.]|nr:class I SAM-dependent methyltransferase [Flavitalea sp.]
MRIADYRFKTYHRCLVEKALVKHQRLITGKALDIGAMRPRYNHLFNASFTAVDLTPNEELGVLYGDIQEGLPFEDNSFDSIICIEVFLYLDQYEKSIGEIYRLLKPGGTAIISTPFMYRDTGDTIRLTESFFLTHFKAFSLVQSLRLGNGFIVIWDILRRKIYSVKNKFVRYLLFSLILPYFAILKIFNLERLKDDFYSGLFFILRK